MLGRHVAVGTSGLAELDEFVKAGKLRPIVLNSMQRVKGVDVPTPRGQGVNVEIFNSCGVYGAAAVAPLWRRFGPQPAAGPSGA